MIKLSLVSLTEIKENNLKKAIEESLRLINFDFNKNIKKIVIKINACYYWDFTTGLTTDPAFVAALIDVIHEKISQDVEIFLIESDASAMKCRYAFRFLGFEKMFENSSVKLVNLSEEKSTKKNIKCNGKSFDFEIPEIIQTADLAINLPKIKYTFKPLRLTCALKNIFGCNPYPYKFKFHSQIGDVVVALNKAMKFDLCIVDSNIASGSQPRKIGLVMASTDSVAIDSVSAKIAGLNPKKIPYLKLAKREGVGAMDFIIKGEQPDYFKRLYPKRTFFNKFVETVLPLVIRLGLGKRLGLA
jgi:uncharacterized protein (DUF362 family)